MRLAPARHAHLTASYNHVLRAVPPQLATVHARSHNQAIWETLLACIGRSAFDDHTSELTHAHVFSGILSCSIGGFRPNQRRAVNPSSVMLRTGLSPQERILGASEGQFAKST